MESGRYRAEQLTSVVRNVHHAVLHSREVRFSPRFRRDLTGRHGFLDGVPSDAGLQEAGNGAPGGTRNPKPIPTALCLSRRRPGGITGGTNHKQLCTGPRPGCKMTLTNRCSARSPEAAARELSTVQKTQNRSKRYKVIDKVTERTDCAPCRASLVPAPTLPVVSLVPWSLAEVVRRGSAR